MHVLILLSFLLLCTLGATAQNSKASRYPAVWFAPINDPNKPDWEILPQEAKPGEVILSKRNELGILSNFAATPFELDGKRYASVEGFWQMMLYPEGPDDERAKDKRRDVEIHPRTGRTDDRLRSKIRRHARRGEHEKARHRLGAPTKASVFHTAPQHPASITGSSSPRCVPSSSKTPR